MISIGLRNALPQKNAPALFRNAFEAVYVPESHPLHTGNPLIDALPPVRSDEDWLRTLFGQPDFDPSQLEADAHTRSYFVANLKHFFYPFAVHAKLARRVDQFIRWGYGYRHPYSPERKAMLQKTYAEAQAAGVALPHQFSAVAPICSYSLIGGSGMGKSTSIERVLASYPQCIWHPDHHLTQVVWLKVDCPKNGDVLDLAASVVGAFDELLGTSSIPASNWRRYGEGYYRVKVKQFAVAHHLGLLVLDEMQNLCAKRSGGREVMLNWFQELVNDLKVPIILLGTYKATNVLQLDMRHARRAGIFGSERWDPLKPGAEFNAIVQALWRFQWLRRPGELTDEMRAVIYEETQGVRAFIVDMFLVAQLYALWKGDETLTPNVFRHVARTEFSAVQPMLSALRSGDPARIRKYDDLMPYQIDEHIEQLRRLMPVTQEEHVQLPTHASTMAEACAKVMSALSISETEAKQLVLRVMNGKAQSARALTRAACKLYYESVDKGDEVEENTDE
nr:MAG: hypothetical protein DIU57_11255 [Pseudomonadota bacterium]